MYVLRLYSAGGYIDVSACQESGLAKVELWHYLPVNGGLQWQV